MQYISVLIILGLFLVIIYKKIEKKLWETKEVYRSMVDNNPHLVLRLDLNGMIIEANKSKEISNYIPEEIVGKPFDRFIEDKCKKEAWEKFNQAKKGEKPIYETVAKRKNGSLINLQIKNIPIVIKGKVTGIFIIAMDITEEKEMKKKLDEMQKKFQLIAENSTDLICIIDKDRNVQYASPSYEKILKIKPSDYVGKNAGSIVHPEDMELLIEAARKNINEKRPFRVEFRKIKAEASEQTVFVESLATPILNELGEIESFLYVSRDITERKKTEEYMRKSDKLNIVGELAAGIAHEIRNPLTSIKGFIQLLEILDKEKVNENYYKVMLSEMERINYIVGEFLVLAKPEAKTKEERNLKMILEHIVKFYKAEAVMKNITIDLNIEEDLPTIMCQENELKQVFLNIIKNAKEAMQKGGKIKITTKREKDHIKIEFKDNGIGITKERIKRIGEPFFTNKEKGTGLGMMISFRIIENHKGKITYESEEGKGTTVCVMLPINK